MFDILNFLLDNWFFTLIVLWLLFGLAGRGNREKAQTDQRRAPQTQEQPQPSQTQTNHEGRRGLSEHVRQAAQELRSQVEEMEKSWQTQHEQELLADVAEKVEAPKERRTPPRKPVAQKQASASPASRAAVHFSIDRESLKQGVIWAEVLGKPRAKRPYRPPYARRE